MKRFSIKIAAALLSVTLIQCCDPYKAEIEYIDGEVSALEEKVVAMNDNLSALTEIMTAMLNNDFVTDVTVNAGSDVTSYDIVFSKSGKITVLCGRDGIDGRDGRNGKDGRDGKDGEDGKTPEITIAKDVDGVWYWKVNGSWLYDSNMKKVPVAGADGVVPRLKIEGEYWYISYDGGVTWDRVASSVDSSRSGLFRSVDFTSFDDYIEIVLKNGEKIQLPKDNPLRMDFSSYESIEAGETVTLKYYVYGYEGTPEIAAVAPEGWSAVITKTSDDQGTITVTAPSPLVYQSILVFASSNGRTIMRTIDFSPVAVDLSIDGTANCYIVPQEGTYSFSVSTTGIGDRISDAVTDLSSIRVEWENDGILNGTGSLINGLWFVQSGSNYTLKFKTAKPYKKGNALISATDHSGKVIWSWHLWFSGYDPDVNSCTYQGADGLQVMDRNLGALSNSSASDISSGAMYQWGRKDPFISDWRTKASSSVSSDVDYALQNPDVFLTSSGDWKTGSSEGGWGAEKTDFDPCPPGWKVAEISLWSSFPSSSTFSGGMTFNSPYSVPFSYYPASGLIDSGSAQRKSSGSFGGVWSASESGSSARAFSFTSAGSIDKGQLLAKATGLPVRCCRIQAAGQQEEGNDTDLSQVETANSYIVSAGGSYKFKATVKGNSHDALDGTPASADVLWETFGTDEKIQSGSIISKASYSNGYVHFTMAKPFREGNALIAVRNRSGQILWSWHIWASAFNPQRGKKIFGSTYVMDRNLGALDATPGTVGSLGLRYQPGRKDPFLSSSDILSNDRPSSTGSFDDVYTGDFNENIYTQAYTVAHPTTYIQGSIPQMPAERMEWETVKDVYDPCPPGWRVMDFSLGDYKFSWNRSKRGMTINGLWFPAAGNHDGSVGIIGEYYLSFSSNHNENVRYEYNKFNSHTDYIGRYGSTSTAARSVRCVEDKLSKELDYQPVTRLDNPEAANSYIVSSPGVYSFNANYKGNSNQWINGTPYAAKVLWETDNTDVAVKPESIVKYAKFYNNTVFIATPDVMKQGNALVAVTDRDGNILWSWHIWVTDYDPASAAVKNVSREGYPLMDRNLGALSSTPGNDLSAGLLYQWGRKDPFAGTSSLSSDSGMALTSSETVRTSDSNLGNPEWLYQYPTVFLAPASTSDGDWQYSSHDASLWSSRKSMYDPCPPGWRVADGGPYGLWGAFPSSAGGLWNASQRGMRVESKYSVPFSWYPAAGYKAVNGVLQDSGKSGSLWSCSNDGDAHLLEFDSGSVSSTAKVSFAEGHSVRCCKDYGRVAGPSTVLYFYENEYSAYEGDRIQISYHLFPEYSDVSGQATWSSSSTSVASVSSTGIITAISEGRATISVKRGTLSASFVLNVLKNGNVRDLSASGSANCYIASPGKQYSFRAVKGNSRESVSGIASVDVLWESYMNDVMPTAGDIVSNVSYESGKILFSTGSKRGNVVIAARSSSGDILWSWHIWVPDNDPTKSPGHFVNHPVDILDRNLGAVTNTAGDILANGLFYQWGRKDPFVGVADRSGEKVKTAPADVMKSVNNNSETGTIEYSIKHPNEVIGRYNNHWLRTNYNSLWQKKKTVYDPCPPGWRVPEYEDGGYMNSFWGARLSYDAQKHGLYVSTDCILPEMWFPAAGRQEYDGIITCFQEEVYLWTSSSESNSAIFFVSHGSNSWGRGGSSRAYGKSVRCVRE